MTPRPEEFQRSRQWAESTFGGAPLSTRPALGIVYEDVADGISRGRSWRGTPFQIGERRYAHGIAFNANKHLRVRLGRPGERFTAEVGLENNDDTQRGAAQGNGSVRFEVRVGDRTVFESPVLRLADGPRPVDVALAGATEFELRVLDGGDGRGWDQSLWGEAVVRLRDGSTLRLQDLPWMPAAGGNPFGLSFVLGGAASSELLPRWSRTESSGAGAGEVQRSTVKYADPDSGLRLRIEVETFADFPAVEWVGYFENAGTTNSPVIESFQALNAVLPVAGAGNPMLYWAKGGVASFDDFAPQETEFKAGVKQHLQPGGGRSSSQVLPFFNLATGHSGVVVAIGWSGEWAADFVGDARGQVSMQAGLARTHLVLHPGEAIRTPRMLLLFYEGDRWRGQNLLRQFLLAQHRPRLRGEPMVAPITCGNWGGTRAEVHLDNIRRIIAERLPLDYYWIDAEWYGKGGWPVNVGDWTVKADLYPAGFRPLSDALRASGRELMLWFEPERVFKGTPWDREHGDWLLRRGGENALWNLGHPAARVFLTRFISERITEFGLGCYRQDFNIDPLPFWQAADAPDRQGMTEIRYIEGLYAFWDGLLTNHPGLLIDNCASGGRRIDLETIGRATPFWRTDGPRDPIAHQCHSLGLLAWVPLSATSQDRAGDDYEFRSSMCSSLCLNWWVSGDIAAERIPADFPFDWARRTLERYQAVRPFYYGDYYPLLAYTKTDDAWVAYQLDRPDLGSGLVVVLRRPQSPYESARIPLRAVDPDRRYRLKELDTGRVLGQGGREMLERGVEVRVERRPGSVLLTYEAE